MIDADFNMIGLIIAVIIAGLFLAGGIKIVRPTHRGIVETLGKYTRFQNSGITYVVPIIQKLYTVNITETMRDVDKQEMITKDNLNCEVDAQIYFKVQESEDAVKNIFYKVKDYEYQIVNLANTTLRNVVGEKLFDTVNSERGTLNNTVYEQITKEIKDWGLDIVRVEIKVITPPKDVQDAMNEVLKAENAKKAAKDYANAKEIDADGVKRAAIKVAQGDKISRIQRSIGLQKEQELIAAGEAKAIELVNQAAELFFIGNAQILKKYQVTEKSMMHNSKIIVTKEGIDPTLVINESKDNVVPLSSDVKEELEIKRKAFKKALGVYDIKRDDMQ